MNLSIPFVKCVGTTALFLKRVFLKRVFSKNLLLKSASLSQRQKRYTRHFQPIACGLMLILAGFSTPATADIAIITHPDNGITALHADELKRFFLKQRLSFSDGKPVQVAELSDQLDLSWVFRQKALRMSPHQYKTHWASHTFSGRTSKPLFFDNQKAMLQWVAKTPGSLGYVDVKMVDDSVKVLLTIVETE